MGARPAVVSVLINGKPGAIRACHPGQTVLKGVLSARQKASRSRLPRPALRPPPMPQARQRGRGLFFCGPGPAVPLRPGRAVPVRAPACRSPSRDGLTEPCGLNGFSRRREALRITFAAVSGGFRPSPSRPPSRAKSPSVSERLPFFLHICEIYWTFSRLPVSLVKDNFLKSLDIFPLSEKVPLVHNCCKTLCYRSQAKIAPGTASRPGGLQALCRGPCSGPGP